MKIIEYKAKDRGHANHGWLNTYHTFSFAGYYNPEKIQFGLFRVLNDDTIEPGQGFGTHPHDNMEIITIPLKGALEHQDSMGHKQVIHSGEVQVMSAGSGITHSEYNHSKTEKVNLFQLWIFPKERNIEPRYDQKSFLLGDRKNKLQLIVSGSGESGSLAINQDAWLSLINLETGISFEYKLRKPKNGLFVFIIEGSIEFNQIYYGRRDGVGISGSESIVIKAKENPEVLFVEVPMN